MVAMRRAPSGAPVFLHLPVYQPVHGHHPSFGSESDGSFFLMVQELLLCSNQRQIHQKRTTFPPTKPPIPKNSTKPPSAPSIITSNHPPPKPPSANPAPFTMSVKRSITKPCWSTPANPWRQRA